MAAVTISRKLGSLGTQIARCVADDLGYRLVWREVINQAARQSGAPEVALAVIDDLDLFGLRPSYRARQAYREAVKAVLEEMAEEGSVVILGRAGQVVLKRRPDVLHVRVIAPLELRIQRVAERQGIPEAAARAQVENSDSSRRNYLRRYHHVDWDDPELYDLVINTANLSASVVVKLIIKALSAQSRNADQDARDKA